MAVLPFKPKQSGAKAEGTAVQKQRAEPGEETPPKPRIIGGPDLMRVVGGILNDLGLNSIEVGERTQVQLRLMEMKTFLESLGGSVNKESIALRRQGLKDRSLEDLYRFVLNGTPNGWTVMAAYYWALLEETNERHNLPFPK